MSSFSLLRRRKSSSEVGDFRGQDPEQRSQPRSSLDTLLTAGRVRYFSDAKGPLHSSSTVDMQVARSLFNHDGSIKDVFSEAPLANSLSTRTLYFVERYNHLARDIGLKELEMLAEEPRDSIARKDSARNTTKNWLLQRLSRKTSVSNLGTRHSLSNLKFQSLEDICRLGGVSLLRLPSLQTSAHLAIPTCLAATGNFLVKHGRESPGIFRIPGQMSVVNALYEHYTALSCADQPGERVQTTIGSNELPTAIAVSTHDVASAFKKFLWDLPGGILGSVTLFNALREITEWHSAQPELTEEHDQRLRLQLVALILLSLASRRRFALIRAVFGLLSFLKGDARRVPPPESMSSRAFGLVFAPILLGDLTDKIELVTVKEPGQPSLPSIETPKRGLLPQRRANKRLQKVDSSPEIVAGLERSTSAANVIEFLVNDWEVICQQMLVVEALSKSSVTTPRSREHSEISGAHENRPLSSQLSSCRSGSLSKSFSTPTLGVCDRQTEDVLRANLPRQESQSVDRNASDPAQMRGGQHLGYLRLDAATFRHMSLSPTGNSTNKDVTRKTSGPSEVESHTNAANSSVEGMAWWEARSTTGSTSSVVVNKSDAHLESPVSTESGSVHGQKSANPFRDPSRESEASSGPHDDRHFIAPRTYGHVDSIIRTACLEKGTAVPHSPALASSPRPDYGGDSTNLGRYERSAMPIDTLGSLHESHFRTPVRRKLDNSTSASSAAKSLSLIPRPVHAPGMVPGRVVHEISSKGLRHTRSMIGDGPELSLPSGPPYARRTVPRRSVAPLPLPCEPPVAHNISFRISQNAPGSRKVSSNNYSSDDSQWHASKKPNVGTLYAEIRRLKAECDGRYEETLQLRQQLDAMGRYRDSGTLSEKLREAERELRFWKHRAQWAEKSLFGKSNGSDAV